MGLEAYSVPNLTAVKQIVGIENISAARRKMVSIDDVVVYDQEASWYWSSKGKKELTLLSEAKVQISRIVGSEKPYYIGDILYKDEKLTFNMPLKIMDNFR